MFYICKRKQSNIKYISSFYCVLCLCHSVLSSYVCHVTSVIKHAHRQLTLFHVHKWAVQAAASKKQKHRERHRMFKEKLQHSAAPHTRELLPGKCWRAYTVPQVELLSMSGVLLTETRGETGPLMIACFDSKWSRSLWTWAHLKWPITRERQSSLRFLPRLLSKVRSIWVSQSQLREQSYLSRVCTPFSARQAETLWWLLHALAALFFSLLLPMGFLACGCLNNSEVIEFVGEDLYWASDS